MPVGRSERAMLRRHLFLLCCLAACGGRRVVGPGRPAHGAVRSRDCSRARPSLRCARTRCRRGPKAQGASASPTINTARSASTRPRRSGATENRTFARRSVVSGLHLRGAGEHQSRRRRHGAARAVHERTVFAYGARGAGRRRRGRAHGLLGLPRARADQRARLPRRVPRVPGRELLPRASRKGQLYGISARGLAVRTARPEGEEFPVLHGFLDRAAAGAGASRS